MMSMLKVTLLAELIKNLPSLGSHIEAEADRA
jgi:hypothetical protein